MLNILKQKAEQLVVRYLRERRASVLAAFALTIPIVIGSAGMALDIAEAYVVRQRLAQALDASTLAGAAMETEEDEITERVNDFFAANYPDEKIGVAYDLEVNVDGDDVIVSAKADFNTSFMHIFGFESITVASSTTVRREVQGLEVVLVLDNTGSMDTNNNIGALRTASENFVEILFERVSDPNDIKIGLVPYSSSVRIGTYGFGETPDGLVYGSGTTFVVDENGDDIDPDRYTTNYDARDSWAANWYGCVVEYNDEGWDEEDDENDPYPFDVNDHEGPWPIYEYGSYETSCSGRGRRRTCTTEWDSYTYPNRYCPYASILPMTSDEEALYDVIDDMQAYGATIGSFGMSWGQRLISPEFPFQEGAAWDDPEWRKAIIMMTDGQNSMGGEVTGYWRTDNHEINNSDLNVRFAEICEDLKAKGALIYTVTFTSSISDDTKDYYRNCATSPSQYYDAPNQADLIDVFETISRQLANLHISR
jgi:Flp pilus assembly protein TadG